MKLVVDISAKLFERLQIAVDRSDYPSIGDFAILALENQLSLETSVVAPSAELVADTSPMGQQDRHDFRVDEPRSAAKLLAPTSAASLNVADDGWLWGIVNRILPIKFALRELYAAHALSPLPLAQQQIAESATLFAQKILANTSTERDRHDTLVTGFPIREPLYPAQQRFSNHYVGRLERSGQTRGALFELGLAGIEYTEGQPSIGLTELGLNLARLPNPTLDSARFDAALSPDEVAYYVENVVPSIPRELDCFVTLLAALENGPKSVEDIDTIVADHLSTRFSPAAIQTQKAGGLGRLRDLGLINRQKDGLTAQFQITEDGQLALRRLGTKSKGVNGRSSHHTVASAAQ